MAAAALLWTPIPAGASEAPAMTPLAFRYENGSPSRISIGRYVAGKAPTSVPIPCQARTTEAKVGAVGGEIHAYCSFLTGEANPAPYEDNQPTGYQAVTFGQTIDGKFTAALRIGLVDDDRSSPEGKASYVPGAYDGKIEYFGMYARPRTTYDFRMKVDLERGKVTIWVSGQGDEEWFPLAIDGGLIHRVTAIDAIRVDQLPKAAGIERLVIQAKPWAEGEMVRPHPLAKAERTVGADQGFKFQAMKSLWRDASRHVTVARRPNSPEGWWLGFPDVVQTGPKTLVANYVDGPGHGGFGRWWVTRSDDLGRTWKDVTVAGRGPACMRLQVLKDGSLLMSEPAVLRSTNGGASWERIGSLDAKKAGGHGADVASRIVEMEDGSWLLAGSYTSGEAWKITDGEALEIYQSSDRGKSWRLYSTVKPAYPLSLSEPTIVPLPDGRMVLYARESGGFIPGVVTFSSDRGKTWGPLKELPFRIGGRTSAFLLKDGRVFLVFRTQNGTPDTCAWVGDPDEATRPLVHGAHINDTRSVGLRNGELYIDSDGMRGQFTKYYFRPPDNDDNRIQVTAEVKVLSNNGRAATISIPFVGKLRLFPDKVVLARDGSVLAQVAPGQFHTYRALKEGAKLTLFVDGREAAVTEKVHSKVAPQAWSAHRLSPYAMEFGNEAAEDAFAALDWVPGPLKPGRPTEDGAARVPEPLYLKNITPSVTGCSIWKRFEVRYEDPKRGTKTASWNALSGEFPDQYHLDRIMEIDGTISGADQGYPGCTQLEDGRILVLNYSDDTARWNSNWSGPPFGVSWIRATFVLPEDLPSPKRHNGK